MEVLNFSNNVEMVALAKKLLEAGDYKYSIDRMTCLYRFHRAGEDEPRRCIFGRLMYGHISEDHPFWNKVAFVKNLFDYYKDFESTFPWMNTDVVVVMQQMHDDAAMGMNPEHTWEQLESMAKMADEEFFAT